MVWVWGGGQKQPIGVWNWAAHEIRLFFKKDFQSARIVEKKVDYFIYLLLLLYFCNKCWWTGGKPGDHLRYLKSISNSFHVFSNSFHNFFSTHFTIFFLLEFSQKKHSACAAETWMLVPWKCIQIFMNDATNFFNFHAFFI